MAADCRGRLLLWLACGGLLALLLRGWTHPAPLARPELLPTAFDGERAFAHVRTLAEQFPHRTTGSAADAAAADWIAAQFQALGLRVEQAPFAAWGAWDLTLPVRHAGLNVVAVSPGAEPDAVVLGAHRDVVPSTVEGAEDNASGSGALLELARVLTARPHRLTYVFVSFGAEEIGLGGSRAYLASAETPTALMLSIDAVGQADGTRLALLDAWSLPYAAAADLRARAAARGLAVGAAARGPLALAGPTVPRGGVTDSLPFALNRMPAVGLSWAAPPYPAHTARDTFDRLSPANLERVGALAEDFVRAVDADPRLLDSERDYLLYAGGAYVPQWQTLAAAMALAAAAVAQLLQATLAAMWCELRSPPRGGLWAAKWQPRATGWPGALIVAAALLGGALPLLRPADAGPTAPELLGWSLLWAALVLLPGWAVRRARPRLADRRLLLVALATLSFFGFLLLRGPYFALLVAGYPLVVWGLLPLASTRRALLVRAALVVPWALVAWGLLLLVAVGRLFVAELLPPAEATAAASLLLLPLGAAAAAEP